MTTPLLLFVAAIYLWVAFGYLTQQDYGMTLVFIAYAVSNFGFTIKGPA